MNDVVPMHRILRLSLMMYSRLWRFCTPYYSLFLVGRGKESWAFHSFFSFYISIAGTLLFIYMVMFLLEFCPNLTVLSLHSAVLLKNKFKFNLNDNKTLIQTQNSRSFFYSNLAQIQMLPQRTRFLPWI